ncbi:hypothetical protein ACHAXN_012070 [Cyclotella atomus]
MTTNIFTAFLTPPPRTGWKSVETGAFSSHCYTAWEPLNGYKTSELLMASARTRPSRRPSPSHTKTGSRSSTNKVQRKQPQANKAVKPKQRLFVEDASSLGEAIQRAQTIPEYLSIIDKFVWLPCDDDLASHLRTQAIHHEKRRRWGSQLIEGLGNAALEMWESNPKDMILQLAPGGSLRKLWTDDRLLRAISSVSLEFDKTCKEGADKEGIWVAAALKGLHVLSSCISPVVSSEDDLDSWINLHRQVSNLIQAADNLLFDEMTLMKDAIEVRWAVRGLAARLQLANASIADSSAVHDNVPKERFSFSTPKINTRTAKLPFDVLPHCLPWQMHNSLEYSGYPTQHLVSQLLEAIPFNFDTLTTRTGAAVIERRGTAWLAEDGIGALAYSGKLMPPQQVPDNVCLAMRDIERWCVNQGNLGSRLVSTLSTKDSVIELLWDDDTSNNLPFLELGQLIQNGETSLEFFDCALCNHYPDGDSACKFHTDPEHGSHWHRTTAVVSGGTSRKFAFRPIPDLSTWAEWDLIKTTQQSKDDAACAPAVAQLFPGDVVLMTGDCNDLFHHAVYAAPFDDCAQNSRVSLVLKRALDRGGGKKGHSLKGEGRRARRNS